MAWLVPVPLTAKLPIGTPRGLFQAKDKKSLTTKNPRYGAGHDGDWLGRQRYTDIPIYCDISCKDAITDIRTRYRYMYITVQWIYMSPENGKTLRAVAVFHIWYLMIVRNASLVKVESLHWKKQKNTTNLSLLIQFNQFFIQHWLW